MENLQYSCVEKPARAMISHSNLWDKYMCFILSFGARNIERIHYIQHGVQKKSLLLDCMHIPKMNSLIMNNGQFELLLC